MLHYFEMERVIEELAKAYPAECATTWFKITKNHKPTKEEYRDKVVEYMKQLNTCSLLILKALKQRS